MESNDKLVESLVTLLGDEDSDVVKTARSKLLEMGTSIIPTLRKNLDERPIHLRLRIRQVINWLKTDPLNRHLPSATKTQ